MLWPKKQEVAANKQNERTACPKNMLEFMFFFSSPEREVSLPCTTTGYHTGWGGGGVETADISDWWLLIVEWIQLLR